jgi:hypothetical protein
MQEIHHPQALEAFVAEYGVLDELIGSLDYDQLVLPSGCLGWSNVDLIFHLLLDVQRALVTFNSPVKEPPDRDFITYWRGFRAADESSLAHARFVRVSAAAHSDPKKLCLRWQETARAAMYCAATVDQVDHVTTQGHVLKAADFMATLTVEAFVHHLDLLANVDDGARPVSSAHSITKRTLEGLLGQPAPLEWDDLTFILKGTGRQALTNRDEQALGRTRKKFPLFS